MKQLVYISTAAHLMTDSELIDILTKARANNAKAGITGVLLYNEGTFIQALEGPEDSVNGIYQKISTDPRHKNIMKLLDNTVAEKDFPEWSMGFPVQQLKDQDLAGYIQSSDKLLNHPSDNSAILMMKAFINTNNLIIKS